MCRANTFLMHNKLVSLNVVQLDVKNSHVCRIRVFCTWNCIEYAKQSFSKLLPLIHTFWLWHKIWFKYVFFSEMGPYLMKFLAWLGLTIRQLESKMSSNETEIAEDVAYCVPGGMVFQSTYTNFHGYLALLICLLGSAANSVNIAVLSRKEMASSTNSILTGLAVADLLVMLDYIPFALHLYTNIGSHTYGWAVFVYFHSIFSQTFHTISIWLTITLAVWRYIAIKFPQKNRTLCNQKNTNIAIGLAYAVCPILCLPIYFAMNIQQVSRSGNKANETIGDDIEVMNSTTTESSEYIIKMTDNSDLLTAIFWIYSVFIKLIPCIVLSILSVLLILKMKSSDRRRQKLLKKSAITTNEVIYMFLYSCFPISVVLWF